MPAAAPAPCCRVLVVEDEPDAREAMARRVSRLGGVAIGVTTATEALGAILLTRPGAVLLDLVRPGRSGVEVLRQVRAYGLPIPVAVTTAVNDPLAFADVAELRPDAVFRKPLDFDEVGRWLLGASGRGSAVVAGCPALG